MNAREQNEAAKGSGVTIGVVLMFIVGLLRLYQGITKEKSSVIRPPSQGRAAKTPTKPPETGSATRQTSSGVRSETTSTASPRACLHILAEDGTSELQTLFAQSQLTAAERRVLGYTTLAPGSDLYAMRVRMENVGALPVRIHPRNLRIHYGNQAVPVLSIEHPSFLNVALLQPKHYVMGLVVYRATLDVGAAIRLQGEGGYSYDDPAISVTYGEYSR